MHPDQGIYASISRRTLCFVLCCALCCLGLPYRAEASSSGDESVTVKWQNGFRIMDKGAEDFYYLRLRVAFQFRYTYMWLDDYIPENSDYNWNNFFLRRLRLFADGNAPSKDWKYFLHIQLEPKSKVNVPDAYVQWQRYRFCRIQFGRMKIPYGLEYWQSGFAQNGVERTIFSGETDVDGKAKDIFGNKIDRFWPGGNANFPVSGHTLKGTLFPVGGLMLYRSQGVDLNGDIHVPGFNDQGTFQYWVGVFNGRDTQGFANPTDQMLYSVRVAYAPLGKWNLFHQGDWPNTQSPKVVFLASFASYTDTASQYYDTALDDYVDKDYGIRDTGYNLAVLLRYRGFSVDLEYGWENFNMQGETADNRDDYDRLGGRVNIGYFLVPSKWEIVFKWAYLERIHDNDRLSSLRTGLGLVETEDGEAVERNLQQYTVGINWYLHGHNQKIALDYSYMLRVLKGVDPAVHVDDQHDYRVRLMYQHFF